MTLLCTIVFLAFIYWFVIRGADDELRGKGE